MPDRFPPTTPSSKHPDRPPVVLVVDDDPAVLASLKFTLELDGLEIHTVETGLALLDRRELATATCIVLDYKMPGMNGLEISAELERRKIKVPVILMTSPVSEKIKRQAGSGANIKYVLEKPLLDNILLDHIRKLIAVTR